jgi:hypothetical protein
MAQSDAQGLQPLQLSQLAQAGGSDEALVGEVQSCQMRHVVNHAAASIIHLQRSALGGLLQAQERLPQAFSGG